MECNTRCVYVYLRIIAVQNRKLQIAQIHKIRLKLYKRMFNIVKYIGKNPMR